jgi:hypothetical protein
MRKTVIVFVMSVMALLFWISFISSAFAEKSADTQLKLKTRTEQIEEMKKEERGRSFVFYGKVVDLERSPVPDAQVVLRKTYVSNHTTKFFDQEEIWLKTDNQGMFRLEEDGLQLSLVRIEKPGYEYHFKYNPKRGFQFSKNKKMADIGQFSDQPVVFKIRKKEKSTLVLTTNANFRLYPGNHPVFWDLLWQQWAYPKRLVSLSHQSKGWQPDVKVYLLGEQGNYRLVLESIDGSTELKVDDNELYIAPQSGYRPKVVLPFAGYEDGKGFRAYVYIKGRGGQFYTRMNLSAGVENIDKPEDKFARLDIDYVTNPNGEGNFEESAELGKQYREDVRFGKRRPYGYDSQAKGLSNEEVRVLLGK